MSRLQKKRRQKPSKNLVIDLPAGWADGLKQAAEGMRRFSDSMQTITLMSVSERRVRAARQYWEAITLAGDQHTSEDCRRVKILCGPEAPKRAGAPNE